MSGFDFNIPGVEDMSSKIADSDIFGDNNAANDLVESIVDSSNCENNTTQNEIVNQGSDEKPKRKYTRKTKTDGSSYRSIDSLSEEEVAFVYTNYSTKPISYICEKLNLSKRGVTSLMNRIHENIRNANAHGDLTDEQLSKLEPMFTAYVETKVKVNHIDSFVTKIIHSV